MGLLSSLLRCQPQPRLFGGLWSYEEGVSWHDFEGSELGGVFWTKGRAEACVDLRGGGCDRIGIERQMEFIRSMLAMGAKCRRVDTAWDDFVRVASMEQIHAACEVKNHSMYRAYKPVRDYRDVVPPTAENPTPTRELREDMVTLGLRGNWGSGRYVRIYDKFLETDKDPEWDCIRYEVENTDEVAEEAIKKLAECKNAVEFQTCIGGLVGGSLNFLERWKNGKYEKNLDRCKPLAWWTAVLSKMAAAGAIVLNISADYGTGPLSRGLKFCFKQFGKTLAMGDQVFAKAGIDFFKVLRAVFDKAAEKINPDEEGKRDLSLRLPELMGFA